MFAAHYDLDNIVLIIDWNGLQIDGKITDVMNPTPLDEKFAAFGWEVFVIDGHDLCAIDDAVTKANAVKGKPSVIIMKTHKGKGVSFMEDNVSWHGSAPNKEQYEAAVAEVSASLK